MDFAGPLSSPVQVAVTLQQFLARKRGCTECPLWSSRKQVVLPSLPADPKGRVLWLGRNPGRTEDQEGKPFVGNAGRELTRWFEYLGWKREDYPIENVVACYTPEDREPEAIETIMCGRWLKEEMAYLKPSLIVALGVTAQQAINANGKHGDLVPSDYGPAYLLWHPSYLCRGKDPATLKALHADLDGLKMAIKHREEIERYKAMYNR